MLLYLHLHSTHAIYEGCKLCSPSNHELRQGPRVLRTLVEPQQAVPTWPARRAPRKKNRLCGLDLRGFKKKTVVICGGGLGKKIRKNSSFTGFESLLVAIGGRIGLCLKMVFSYKNFGPRAVMKVTSWYLS